MILYLSAATSYKIYDENLEKGLIAKGSYQVQKFNNNLIKGLSCHEKIVSLAALSCGKNKVPAIHEKIDGVEYYCVKNTDKICNKVVRVKELYKTGKKIIKDEKPRFIICDSISFALSYVAIKLGKRFNIPTVAIVTDVPEKYCGNGKTISMKLTAKYMKKYEAYILLSQSMNEIVNKKNKPYLIMEGACGDIPGLRQKSKDKKIILYSGSLWKGSLGLEYFVKGFIQANLKDVELHFYGVGAFASTLEKIHKVYPQIKYMGCVTNEEVVKKQAEAHLLFNSRPKDLEFSKYSFPSKTFEYMVSGTPLLMTRLYSIPDEYFNYTYCIEEETSEFVCEKLKEIFSNYNAAEEKGLKARQFIIENKTAIIQSKRIIEFINSIN